MHEERKDEGEEKRRRERLQSAETDGGGMIPVLRVFLRSELLCFGISTHSVNHVISNSPFQFWGRSLSEYK